MFDLLHAIPRDKCNKFQFQTPAEFNALAFKRRTARSTHSKHSMHNADWPLISHQAMSVRRVIEHSMQL